MMIEISDSKNTNIWINEKINDIIFFGVEVGNASKACIRTSGRFPDQL